MAKHKRQQKKTTVPAGEKTTTRDTATGLPWYRKVRFQAVGLFLLSFLLYANTLGHDFALDDAIVITDNEIVQRGISGWGDLFSHDTFYGFFMEEGKANLVAGGRYRPLTPAMFALEQQISSGPFLHHLLNVFWYGALVVVIFGFVRDLVRQEKAVPWWFALGVAALFAAHPLHTEAVANIKGRDEIIALLGAVGGTWLIFRATQNGQFRGAVAGAVLLFLGCLAKENAITFLAVIPVVLLLPGKSGAGRGGWLRYLAPALVAGAVFLVLRTAVIGWSLGDPVRELMNNPFLELKNGVWTDISTSDRLATVMHTLWEYLRLLFAPVNLVHDYYPRAIPIMNWANVTPWLGLLLHVGLGVFALLKWRTHRLLTVGIVIYLATLSIVSNVFFSVGTNMSERFLFMPSLGWALAITALIAGAGRKLSPAAAWIIPVITLVFGGMTIARNPAWKDNLTLFTTDVKKQPNSAKLLNAAGGARVDYYQSLPSRDQAAQQQLLVAAEADLTRAIEIHPTYRNAYLLRGNAHLLLKEYDAAIADYDQAIDMSNDGYPAATDNLVIALTAAGQDAGEGRGDLNGAFRYLRRAEQLAPDDYETLRLLGVASGVSGQTAQALNYFQRAAQARPNDPEARWNYAIALYNAGQTEAAEAEFQEAERLKPGIRKERAG